MSVPFVSFVFGSMFLYPRAAKRFSGILNKVDVLVGEERGLFGCGWERASGILKSGDELDATSIRSTVLDLNEKSNAKEQSMSDWAT